jgi:hypothetical protein
MHPPVPFSWRALLLAPLPLPAVVAVWFAFGARSGFAVRALFAALQFGGFLSFAGTVILLLPALAVVSRLVQLRTWRAAVVGAVMGLPVYALWVYSSWTSSGSNSGPPGLTFGQWLHQFWTLADLWILASIAVAGAIDGGLNWALSVGFANARDAHA